MLKIYITVPSEIIKKELRNGSVASSKKKVGMKKRMFIALPWFYIARFPIWAELPS